MVIYLLGRLGSLFSGDRRDEHTRWLIRRLKVIMQFDDPHLFDQIEYQKEGLLVLVASAHKTQKAWLKYSKQPTDHELEHSYQTLRNIYTYDVETLKQAHTVFKDLDIHWSKLPEFIKRWRRGNPVTWDARTDEHISLLESA